MKKLILIMSFWSLCMATFINAQLLDVTVNQRSSLGIFESSEVKNFKVVPWVGDQSDDSEAINVAADASNGLTKMRIYNMIPFPVLHEPFPSLEVRLLDGDDDNPDAKYFGKVNVESVTNENILISYNHPSAMHPDYKDERYYEVLLQIGRLEIIPESPDEEWVSFANWIIRIYRPPVLFVHGLWSNGAAFKDMDEALYESELYGVANDDGSYHGAENHTLRVNYEETNDFSFLHNHAVIPQGIAQLLHTKSKVIAHKVDIVCHSMGGVLSRLYLQNILTPYNNDINRLITCNTPHSGAQSANLLFDDNLEVSSGTALGRDILCPLLIQAEFGNCFNGAVSDLRAGVPGNGTSALLNGNSLNANKVPSFTITTTEELSNFEYIIPYEELSNWYILINALTRNSIDCGEAIMGEVFNNLESDWVVTQPSQEAGLPPASTANVTSQNHLGSVANPEVISLVLDLLNKNPNGIPFTKNGFNPPPQQYGNPVLPCGHAPSSSDPELKITGPINGHNVISGNNLQVTLSANDDVFRTMVVVHASSGKVYMRANESGDMVHNFEIGEHLIGEKKVIAIGFDIMGAPIIASKPIHITITPNATLDSISVYPETILTTHNFQNSIEITGHYSDGITRDIKRVDGLNYDFKHAFAKKGEAGGISGVSQGIDTLTLQMGEIKSTPIRVIVVEGQEVSTSTQSNQTIKSIKPGKLNVYPNPAIDILKFETEGPSTITISTIEGKQMQVIKISDAGEQTIDISMIPPGHHIIQCNDGQSMKVGKFIIAE